MRKILMIGMAVWALAGAANAQNREIRMPESPKATQLNIAEADRGFWCVIEAGGGSTLMEEHKNVGMLEVSYTGGYRFNQYLKVGVGLGVLYYPNGEKVRDSGKKLAMPLFLNLRGNLLSDEIRRTVPFWSVNVGTAMPDGLFLTPSVGLRIGEKRNAFLMSVGYTLRHLKTAVGCCENYSGAMVKLGYEF